VNDDHYRVAEVTKGLVRVLKGDSLVGQARQGLDGQWYAEQTGEKTKSAAINKVMIANEAIEQYLAASNGNS